MTLENGDLKLVNFKNAKSATNFTAGLDFASKKALGLYSDIAKKLGVLLVKDSEGKAGDRVTARFSGTPKTVRLSIRVAKGKAGIPAFKGKMAKYYGTDLDDKAVISAEKEVAKDILTAKAEKEKTEKESTEK